MQDRRILLNVAPAVRRGRALRCKLCNERGATLGCFQEGCPAVYHLQCAQSVGCQLQPHSHEVRCPQHSQSRRQIEQELGRLSVPDEESEGRTFVPRKTSRKNQQVNIHQG
ncbi:MAG: hypothetical protein WDW36_005802 [Sanguina aurantia]